MRIKKNTHPFFKLFRKGKNYILTFTNFKIKPEKDPSNLISFKNVISLENLSNTWVQLINKPDIFTWKVTNKTLNFIKNLCFEQASQKLVENKYKYPYKKNSNFWINWQKHSIVFCDI